MNFSLYLLHIKIILRANFCKHWFWIDRVSVQNATVKIEKYGGKKVGVNFFTGDYCMCTFGSFGNVEGMAELGRPSELPAMTEPYMTKLDVFSKFPSKLYHSEAPPLITLDDLQDSEAANTDNILIPADHTNFQDEHGQGYSLGAESYIDEVYYPQQESQLSFVQPDFQSHPGEDPTEHWISEDIARNRRSFGG